MTTPSISRSPDRAPGRHVRRAGGAAAAVVATVGLALAHDAVAGEDTARLHTVQDLPDDVQAELDVTWRRFVDRFDARTGCVDDVSVELVRAIDGGDARYVIDGSVIEIKIPTTPSRFRESLVHELAHHVEYTCGEFAELRRALHPQLGDPEAPWAGGDDWEETPSERWAEAVVLLVNGERIRHTDEIPVDPAVVALVEAWAGGAG